MADNEKQCSCTKCFLQNQFVPLVLVGAVVVAALFTVYVMTRFKDDGDIIWAQGIFGQLLAAFLLSLVGNRGAGGQHQGDTIKTGDNAVVNTTPVAAPPAEPLVPSGLDRG